MSNLTKQDVQSIVDGAKGTILQRSLTKQDILTINEVMRDRVNNYSYELHQQDRQILRQTNYQTAQLIRRTISLETRIVALDQEIKSLRQVILRLAEQRQPQTQQIVMPVAPNGEHPSGTQQYVYRTN